MKPCLIALPLLLLLLSNCSADGGLVMPPDYTDSVFMPEQKAVVFWDGQTEQLVLESKITTEDIASLAWLIPIESSTKPVVEEADEQIFFELADLFRPKPKSEGYGILGTMGRASDEGVEVVEQISVDIYDLTILRATDEMALVNWLNSNGYSFPEAFPNLLYDYVRSGSFYFIANKINLQNKYPGLEPTSQDFDCAQRISRESYFGYPGFREEAVESYMYFVECEDAYPEAVAVLVSLRLGIGTPLKITFTPSRPFYPMVLSSLNLGQGSAIIYFVSGQAYADNTGLFSTKNMLQVKHTGLSEHGISKGDTVTLLSWQGSYSALDRDSFFAQTPFVPELDPGYVPPPSPLEIISGALSALLLVLVLSLTLGLPFLVVPFLIGFALAFIFEQKKKKKSFFAQGNGVVAWLSTAALVLAGPFFLFLFLILPSLVFGLMDSYLLPMLVITLIIFLPYFVSMVFGFLFRRSGHKLRYLLAAIAVFVLLVFAFLLLLSQIVYF